MKYKNFFSLLLVVISIIPLFDLIHPGLPITHDGQDHVARIANFYQNLTEGNIIPRWAPNLNWGYGHPILMFLYPLPSYFASLFHFLGFSFVDSVKIVFAIAFIVSGITMYLWIKSFLSKESALVAAVLYMYAPYRFVDLYVRGAIGEHVAFIFPPLVFLAIFSFSKKKEWGHVVYGAFSFAGLILSHNAIALMFLPLFLLYFFLLNYFEKEKKLFFLKFTSMTLLGFGLSSFFVIPAFLEGKYTLRDIVTGKSYATSFSSFDKFLFGQWSYGGTGAFSVQIGIVQWVFIILGLILLFFAFKKNKQMRILLFFLELLFLFTLFLMTAQSNVIWDKLSILQKFQFPWRFLSISVFITSVIGGITFSVIKAKYKNIFLILIIGILLFANKNYWHANGYLYKQESFFTGVYNGTTDTGESAPIWSVRFMEKRPNNHIEIIKGFGEIKEINHFITRHTYQINVSETSRIRENTLYFPGWNVLVDGKKVPIEFQDPANRGLITFFTEKGQHLVTIKFTETKLRILADVISLISLVFIAFLAILNKRLLWQHFL